jgi:hypothetical protein
MASTVIFEQRTEVLLCSVQTDPGGCCRDRQFGGDLGM